MLKRMTIWLAVICCMTAAGGELHAGLLALSGDSGPDLGQTHTGAAPQAVWLGTHNTGGRRAKSRDYAVAVLPHLARGAS